MKKVRYNMFFVNNKIFKDNLKLVEIYFNDTFGYYYGIEIIKNHWLVKKNRKGFNILDKNNNYIFDFFFKLHSINFEKRILIISINDGKKNFYNVVLFKDGKIRLLIPYNNKEDIKTWIYKEKNKDEDSFINILEKGTFIYKTIDGNIH